MTMNTNVPSVKSDMVSMNHVKNTNSVSITDSKTKIIRKTMVPTIGTSKETITADSKKRAGKDKQILPTPVNVKRLKKLLYGYNRKDKNFLIQGFKKGFKIGTNEIPPDPSVKNSKSLDKDIDYAREKIAKEVKAGRMAGPYDFPPLRNFHVSPIGLREKKTGGYRLIHNLSYPYDDSSVNAGIPEVDKKVSVKFYTNFHQIINLIHSDDSYAFCSSSSIIWVFT